MFLMLARRRKVSMWFASLRSASVTRMSFFGGFLLLNRCPFDRDGYGPSTEDGLSCVPSYIGNI